MLRTVMLLCLAGLVLGASFEKASGQELAVDLSKPDAADAWVFSDERAAIRNGELVLDGRAEETRAFFTPFVWGDVSLKAKFLVEPREEGVLACGFAVRATDAFTCYYVHYDRGQAILCRSDASNSWIEIKRVSGLDKPAGQWHEGELACVGNTLRVSLNGAVLYEAQDAAIQAGRIGFYAGQGLVHVKDIVVTGAATPAEGTFTIPKPMFIRLCTDANAGAYEAFPDVCRLSDGRLMSVFYAGYGHVALPNEQLPRGGRVSYCVSRDEGVTWSAAKVLYDGPDDDRDPSIMQTKTGKLICNYFSLRKKDGAELSWEGLGTWMVTSLDMGKTWSEPQQIATNYYCSSPVRQLSDGRLILGLYAEQDGRGWGAVTISDDDGANWGNVIDIDNNGMPLDAETDIIELKNGDLFAAERGRGETMAWSASKDRGLTWSVSEPFGFPGHCPYLLRAAGDIILMAHRLPATSLHYSLDECATWSENVPVDSVGGAYPSMVNLDDGSVLIVYYEEGEGSSIRAKRLHATPNGIEWLPVSEGRKPQATLVEQYKIWDQAPHNAFTNLVRFKDEWFCVFREGQAHVSPDGALRIIVSKDGKQWESAALITSGTADLRDAQITVTPGGKLMLSGAAAFHDKSVASHQTMAYFSEDGRSWSEGVPVADPNFWMWRVTWHKGTCYGIGYATVEEGERSIRLYKSTDGRSFETLVPALRSGEYSNESSIIFLEDDTALCLLRRDSPAPLNTGLLGTSKPPYTEWTWQDLGARIGGPCMIQIPDGRFVGAVRLYDRRVRTGICILDPEYGTLTEVLTLPSGGDTSYPGLVWHDGLLWVSYYSSHEGKTSIYLAKVAFN
ncbi:MAG TPA: exo-alpha-sialidase [Candidatus Hydrogenedentes bacterium]|nr:exo-alpha-sialidase [Candidatus Hydrogenedentota bacterium]HQM49002.1 exo-alpha-sialidase [Candidatus Hydrogenedentota bacterium]